MLDKLIKKVYLWSAKRLQKKQTKKQLTEKEKQRQEVISKLRELYQFVNYLNTKVLTSRVRRKAFWRSVCANKPVLENIIQQMIDNYEKEKK